MAALDHLRPVAPPLPDHDLTAVGNTVGNDILTAAIAAGHSPDTRSRTDKRAWTVGGNGD